MKTTRNNIGKTKGIFILVLFVMVMINTLSSQAQHQKKQSYYRGFDVSFGTKNSMISSNISQINEMSLWTEGGSAGVITGNSILRAKLDVGFYYSSASVAYTIDQFQSSASANFYPLGFIKNHRGALSPYFMGGLTYDKFKFAGRYLDGDGASINYSTVADKYIGQVNQVNINTGLGVEYKLIDRYDFFHLYAEVKYGMPVSYSTKTSAFSETKSGNQMMISVGVRFGVFK